MTALFPVAGGLLTLLGISVTLLVTGRRERAKHDRERIDTTRSELRAHGAELVAVFYEFAASADNLTSQIADHELTDGALADHGRVTLRLRSQVVKTRLLTDHPRLIEPLEALIRTHEAVNDEIVDTTNAEPRYAALMDAGARVINGLYTVALPTDIVKGRLKIAGRKRRRQWKREARERKKKSAEIFDPPAPASP